MKRLNISHSIKRTMLPAIPFLFVTLVYAADPDGGKPGKRTAKSPPSTCDCSTFKMIEVRRTAVEGASTVIIDCNLTLQKHDVITKALILQGSPSSDITINGNGALINGGRFTFNFRYKDSVRMIDVRSVRTANNRWQRPSNIRISNLRVIGSVIVHGVNQATGKRLSRQQDGVRKLREISPTAITLDSLTVTGIGGDLLYFGGGVTDSKLINSTLNGEVDGVPLYLDAETSGLEIINNRFETRVGNREIIAIDGSEHNKIMNNTFINPNSGGIFLYRNCGEDSIIRHTSPSHNEIINNVFKYASSIVPSKKAVFIGSRDAHASYCTLDRGYPFGSSISDQDYASNNAVVQNQFVNKSPDDMIKIGGDKNNKDNYVDYNTKIDDPVERPAGCYIEQGYKKFIASGESIDVFVRSGAPVCNGSRYDCKNGRQERHAGHSDCQVTQVPFDLRVEGNNDGKEEPARCTGGTKIVGVWMACQLENPEFQNPNSVSAPLNFIAVLRPSDHLLDGMCWIGDNKENASRRPIVKVLDETMVTIGCREHDNDGGDCRVKGMLYCR